MNTLERSKSPTEQAETGALIGALGLLFGESLPKERIALYELALEDVPVAALKAGFGRTIKTRTFFPKPAELRADVDAVLEAQREAEQRRQRDAERREARVPFSVFGRMSKNAVLHRFNGFVADDPCECVACWDAQVAGPPRFVPDGISPAPHCALCDDSGWIQATERTPVAAPSFRKCACHGVNHNLVPATRDHSIEMGRWLHGTELREHELAQDAFYAALRGAVDRARMSKMETR